MEKHTNGSFLFSDSPRRRTTSLGGRLSLQQKTATALVSMQHLPRSDAQIKVAEYLQQQAGGEAGGLVGCANFVARLTPQSLVGEHLVLF